MVSKDEDSECDISKTYNCHICDITVPNIYFKEHSESKKHLSFKKLTDKVIENATKHSNETYTHNTNEKVQNKYFYCELCSKAELLDKQPAHYISDDHTKAIQNDMLVDDFLDMYFKTDSTETVEDIEHNDSVNSTVKRKFSDVESDFESDNFDSNDSNKRRKCEESIEYASGEIVEEAVHKTSSLKENTEITAFIQYLKEMKVLFDLEFELPIVENDFIVFSSSGGCEKVSINTFHSYKDKSSFFYCQLCKVCVAEHQKDSHNATEAHFKLITLPIDDHLIRQINDMSSHCLICNEIVINFADHPRHDCNKLKETNITTDCNTEGPIKNNEESLDKEIRNVVETETIDDVSKKGDGNENEIITKEAEITNTLATSQSMNQSETADKIVDSDVVRYETERKDDSKNMAGHKNEVITKEVEIINAPSTSQSMDQNEADKTMDSNVRFKTEGKEDGLRDSAKNKNVVIIKDIAIMNAASSSQSIDVNETADKSVDSNLVRLETEGKDHSRIIATNENVITTKEVEISNAPSTSQSFNQNEIADKTVNSNLVRFKTDRKEDDSKNMAANKNVIITKEAEIINAPSSSLSKQAEGSKPVEIKVPAKTSLKIENNGQDTNVSNTIKFKEVTNLKSNSEKKYKDLISQNEIQNNRTANIKTETATKSSNHFDNDNSRRLYPNKENKDSLHRKRDTEKSPSNNIYKEGFTNTNNNNTNKNQSRFNDLKTERLAIGRFVDYAKNLLCQLRVEKVTHKVVVRNGFVLITAPNGNKKKFSPDVFHSFQFTKYAIYCQLCKTWLFKDILSHEVSETHVRNVMQTVDENFTRKICNQWNHCLICNEIVPNNSSHIQSDSRHRDIYNINKNITAKKEKKSLATNVALTYCEYCKYYIQTHNFESHLKGLKHKRNKKAKEGYIESNSDVEIVEQDIEVIIIDDSEEEKDLRMKINEITSNKLKSTQNDLKVIDSKPTPKPDINTINEKQPNYNKEMDYFQLYIKEISKLFKVTFDFLDVNKDSVAIVTPDGQREVISVDAFHSYRTTDVSVYCQVCQMSVTDAVQEHCETEAHVRRVSIPVDNDFARKINKAWTHCVVCNQMIFIGFDHVTYSATHKKYSQRKLNIDGTKTITNNIENTQHSVKIEPQHPVPKNQNQETRISQNTLRINPVAVKKKKKRSKAKKDNLQIVIQNDTKIQKNKSTIENKKSTKPTIDIQPSSSQEKIVKPFNSHQTLNELRKHVGYERNIFQCFVCNIRICKRDDIINSHVVGKKHEKNVRQILNDNSLKRLDDSFYCNLCDIQLIDFLDHINAKDHVKNKILGNIDKNYLKFYVYQSPLADSKTARAYREIYEELLVINKIKKLSDSMFSCEACGNWLSNMAEIEHMFNEEHKEQLRLKVDDEMI